MDRLLGQTAEFYPLLNQFQKDLVIGLFSLYITDTEQLESMLAETEKIPAEIKGELGQQRCTEFYEFNGANGRDRSQMTFSKIGWLKKVSGIDESIALFEERRTKHLLSSEIMFKLSREHLFLLMLIIPKHLIKRAYIVKGEAERDSCLELLHELINRNNCPSEFQMKEFLVSEVLAMNNQIGDFEIPSRQDQLILKLEKVFIASDYSQKQKILSWTEPLDKVKVALIRTLSIEDIKILCSSHSAPADPDNSTDKIAFCDVKKNLEYFLSNIDDNLLRQ